MDELQGLKPRCLEKTRTQQTPPSGERARRKRERERSVKGQAAKKKKNFDLFFWLAHFPTSSEVLPLFFPSPLFFFLFFLPPRRAANARRRPRLLNGTTELQQ